jgi:hypothetical protein
MEHLGDGIDIQALIQSAMGEINAELGNADGGERESHETTSQKDVDAEAGGQELQPPGQSRNPDDRETHDRQENVMDESELLQMIESASAALGTGELQGDNGSTERVMSQETSDGHSRLASGQSTNEPSVAPEKISGFDVSVNVESEQSRDALVGHGDSDPSKHLEGSDSNEVPMDPHDDANRTGTTAHDGEIEIDGLQEAIRSALQGDASEEGSQADKPRQSTQHVAETVTGEQHDVAGDLQDAIRAALHGAGVEIDSRQEQHHQQRQPQQLQHDASRTRIADEDVLAQALTAALGGGTVEDDRNDDGIDPALRETSMEPGIDPALQGDSSNDVQVDPSLHALGHTDHDQQQHQQQHAGMDQYFGNVDLETAIANLLNAQNQLDEQSQQQQQQQQHGQHAQRRGDRSNDSGKPGGLSIAETLAITRSQMQKSRQDSSNKIDLMLTRKGYGRSRASAIPSTSTFRVQPIPARPLHQQMLPSASVGERAQSAPPTALPDQETDDVRAALLLAKQMIEGDLSATSKDSQGLVSNKQLDSTTQGETDEPFVGILTLEYNR